MKSTPSSALRRLLIVDDNDKYARLLEEHFAPLGYAIERAVTAAAGVELVEKQPPRHFQVIVTDLTMESQLAGMFMLGRITAERFNGTIVVASTGFDFPGVLTASRALFRLYGVHYLVPKTTVLKKEPLFYPMGFFSAPTRNFVEQPPES